MKNYFNNNKPNLLYVSFWPWDSIQSVPQHLASQFSKKYNVIYVSPLQFQVSNNKAKHFSNILKLTKKINDEGMLLLQFPFLPCWKFNFLRNFNHYLWAKAVNLFLLNNKISIDILWLNSPEQLSFFNKFSFKLVTYHCLDENESFYAPFKYTEPIIFKNSDLVIATAPLLVEKALKYNNNVHLIPNGAELDHFRSVLEKKFKIPNDISHLKKPIIGYIGTVADWMDYEILEHIYDKLNVTIVLIGPVESSKAISMEKQGKIVLLNRKPYKELPAYLYHFDLCIIPFIDNELTRAVDPIKIYEYLAAGKEVVSTPLPPLKRFSKFIDLESDPKLFCDAVNRIIENPTSLEKSKTLSLEMENHSWKARAENIMNIFEENL